MEPATTVVLNEKDTLIPVVKAGEPIKVTNLSSKFVGLHDACGGEIWLMRSTTENNVLMCTKCDMRVPVPAALNTFQEVFEHFQKPGPA